MILKKTKRIVLNIAMAPAGGSTWDFVSTLVTTPIVSASKSAITPNIPASQILPVTCIARPAMKEIG